MGLRNNQILVTSVNKAINKAKVTGRFKTKEIAIFKLLDYYINFTQATIDNGSLLYKDINVLLSDCIRKFSYQNSSVICNYKISTNPNIPIIGTTETVVVPPVVTGITINIGDTCNYIFTVANFTTNYYDAGNNAYSELIIYLDSLPGTFKYNNVIVTGTLQIPVSQVTKLTYTCANNNGFSFNIPFRIKSVLQNSAFSSIVNNTLVGTAVVVANNPATIGDNILYEANRVTTILTLAMFTTQLAPPYSDPENDLIDAIRIDSISGANLGIYYLNNIAISVGLIITREDLIAGVFKHIGADIDTVSSDTFTFSARDEGSQIWVN